MWLLQVNDTAPQRHDPASSMAAACSMRSVRMALGKGLRAKAMAADGAVAFGDKPPLH